MKMKQAATWVGGMILASVSGLRADDAKELSYASDVAPILFAHCAECHRPGQIGPMSLLSYDETRPWAKSIKKAVASRAMPPWDADPAHGKWANDISLSEAEINTISAWVDQGAPMGDASDMPTMPKFPEGWTIGEPDMIIELPETVVPTEGPDLFPDHVMTLELPQGAWLSAVEILPGNREVLHHVVAFLGEAAMRANADGEATPPGLRGGDVAIASIWAAGTPPTVNPEGTGHPLKAKQIFTFNMHYHPSGREAVDHTRVGLHFGKDELKKRMKTMAAMNAGFMIPPRKAGHEIRGWYRFNDDTTIVSLFPHMHLRGRDFEYILHHPDGKSETLLRVPEYDFNWQWVYYPEKPIEVEAGSRIEVVGIYDNSPANPNNPNPEARIGFGEETDDEMLIGFMDVIPTEGTAFPAENAGLAMTEFLKTVGAEDSYLVSFGAMMPASAGFYLPKSGDGAMYLWANSTMALVPITDVRWNGAEVTGRMTIFATDMLFKGAPGEGNALNITMDAPNLQTDDPQLKFIVKMLANLKGERLKPSAQLSSAN